MINKYTKSTIVEFLKYLETFKKAKPFIHYNQEYINNVLKIVQLSDEELKEYSPNVTRFKTIV